MLYQLSYAPRLPRKCIGAFRRITGAPASIARVPMVALFTSITVAFALIAAWTIDAGRYPIGVAAAALAAWMGTLAWSALRRMRS